MSITLSPEIERLIAEKLQSGRYASVDEIIREGLELLDQRDSGESAASSPKLGDLAEIMRQIAREVPESEWERLPTDLARNLDH